MILLLEEVIIVAMSVDVYPVVIEIFIMIAVDKIKLQKIMITTRSGQKIMKKEKERM
jgi:hypothetical protein